MFWKLIFSVIVCFLSANLYAADVYWVDDAGTETVWANCESDPDPGSGYCSLAAANTNAAAGDTVYLKGGTYSTALSPSNSGTSGNEITFLAATGEVPDIQASDGAVNLDDVDYIILRGLTVTATSSSGRAMIIGNGSTYIEIDDCIITGGKIGIRLWGSCGDGNYNCHVSHVWMHDNTIYENGGVDTETCQDTGGNVYIGSSSAEDESSYITFEDNLVYSGGHHCIETTGEYLVIRNNVVHNEGWMDPGECEEKASYRNSKYGNRGLQIYDGDPDTKKYILVEGNRIGHTAFASDGSVDADYTITAPGNIIRYNYGYYSERMGMYFKVGTNSYGQDNRVYNNTIYYAGQDSQAPDAPLEDLRDGIKGSENVNADDNVVKNNIFYDSYGEDIHCDTNCTSGNTFSNNWTTTDGNPGFLNTDVSDPTSISLPNLGVQSDSGVIDNGTYLTQVSGTESDETELVVDDADYFQDGSWGSGLSSIDADYICVGISVDGAWCEQISSINYATDTINLESAQSWDDDDYVWLYKTSNGSVVLTGSAPDQCAYEYAIKPSRGITASGVTIR